MIQDEGILMGLHGQKKKEKEKEKKQKAKKTVSSVTDDSMNLMQEKTDDLFRDTQFEAMHV